MKKMNADTKPFAFSEALDSKEQIAAYLEEAFAQGDAALIAKAMHEAARARDSLWSNRPPGRSDHAPIQ